MNVLIPVVNPLTIFHDNLFQTPLFAKYRIETHRNGTLHCYPQGTFANPYRKSHHQSCANHGICDRTQCTTQHLQEHYTLTEDLKNCDYILIHRLCDTMTQALRQENIKIYQMSPFLQKTDIAIKNFLLGVCLASTLQQIHIKA